MHPGPAQPYCGFLAGSDAASSAVASASRALFVQGAKLRHSISKCGSLSNSRFLFASFQARVRLSNCDLHLSKVSICLQAHKLTRSTLQNMHSLVPLGHTSHLKLPGPVHPPFSGDFCRGNSHIACYAVDLTTLLLECSDLTREDLQELWRYTTSVPSLCELLPKDLPKGEML